LLVYTDNTVYTVSEAQVYGSARFPFLVIFSARYVVGAALPVSMGNCKAFVARLLDPLEPLDPLEA
jgi:hypothetical protein